MRRIEKGRLEDLAVFLELARSGPAQAAEALKDESTREAMGRLAKSMCFHVIKLNGVLTSHGAILFRNTVQAWSTLHANLCMQATTVETPPMSTMESSPDLHDAVLLHIDSQWRTGDALIWIQYGPTLEQLVIKGLETSRVDWRRSHPWGASVFINEVRGPIQSETLARLEIEMQSGDTLILEAQEFEFGTW